MGKKKLAKTSPNSGAGQITPMAPPTRHANLPELKKAAYSDLKRQLVHAIFESESIVQKHRRNDHAIKIFAVYMSLSRCKDILDKLDEAMDVNDKHK